MSARLITADLPKLAEPTSFVRHLRGVFHKLLRRFISVASTDQRALAIEDRVSIGPKKSLLLVRCHGQRYLIASTGDTIGPVIEVATPKSNRRATKPVSKERKA